MDELEIIHLDELESFHFWYVARKYFLERWLLNNVPLESSILDLGSATGGNTLFMQDLGYKVISAENSSIGISIQKKKGIPVVKADATKLPFEDQQFDVVICMDVLEHICEDAIAIEELSRVLKFGGKYLVSVPEDPALWSEHDKAVNHYRRYTKKTLQDRLVAAGLEPMEIFSSMVVLRPIVKIRRRFTLGSDLKRLPLLLNWFLLLICKVESLLPFGKFQGTTIWVSGYKPYDS